MPGSPSPAWTVGAGRPDCAIPMARACTRSSRAAPPGPPASAARNGQDRSSSAPVRLTVHDGTSRHTVHLDELTHTLAVAWLRERQERWPGTATPYLLVSQQTAVDPSRPPVTPTPDASPSPR